MLFNEKRNMFQHKILKFELLLYMLIKFGLI